MEEAITRKIGINDRDARIKITKAKSLKMKRYMKMARMVFLPQSQKNEEDIKQVPVHFLYSRHLCMQRHTLTQLLIIFDKEGLKTGAGFIHVPFMPSKL